MPIQEALVRSVPDLERPSGVLFDPPCATRDSDLKSWKFMIPMLAQEWRDGREIMVLVQCRNTRDWDSNRKNFAFNPSEDYLIAAYSVAPSLGKPYRPCLCSEAWLDEKMNGTSTGTNDMYQVFQCSPRGCNLSVVGATRLFNFHMENGNTSVEASSLTKGSFLARKYGWQGGAFPPRWMSAKPRQWVPAKPRQWVPGVKPR